jgi:hypothetical protein
MPAATKRGREEPHTALKHSLTEKSELLQTDDFLYDLRYP